MPSPSVVAQPTRRRARSAWVLALKFAFSIGMLAVIYRSVLGREGGSALLDRLGSIAPEWFAAAIGMQLVAIACSIWRWERLLVGQGIFATRRLLAQSFLIGRFWGAFTPGGFTGLGGWRIYDIARRTGKTARATAAIGVETIVGQLAFGVVVMLGSVHGLRFLGRQGVLTVNLGVAAVILTGVTLLARPGLARILLRVLPSPVAARAQTLVEAICAYQGRWGLLSQAGGLGVGTHIFNNLIYVCAAQALGIELGLGEVFFASSLQILATLVPASINGIGLREMAAVALYTQLGVPAAEAVLIPVVGFAAEMLVSASGGVLFVLHRSSEPGAIRVDDIEREHRLTAATTTDDPKAWPKVRTGIRIGASAGLLGGALVGLSEAALVWGGSKGLSSGWRLVLFAAAGYASLAAVCAGGLGGLLAWTGRRARRTATPPALAFARATALIVATLAAGMGAFLVRRDLFLETLRWKSLNGLLVLAGCALAAGALYWSISRVLDRWLTHKSGRFLLQPWGAPVATAALITLALLLVTTFGRATPSATPVRDGRPAAPAQAGNILFVVVDTLRADHLPLYGYARGRTPALDAFANDAVVFDQAFANASWTRPSFASMLTGRFPASHGVMAKRDALPDAVVTLPEALRAAGWSTVGLVTNYNVSPYFNFDQGFDDYRYLEPRLLLGADEASAKLLWLQFARQKVEGLRARQQRVEPGTAYQDAATVNLAIGDWLERQQRGRRQDGRPQNAPQRNKRPWLLFAGYMDPHDPYFAHPYDGTGYARAAHQKPKPEEADTLRGLYDQEITYWDQHFGALVGMLKRAGLYDALTIVVTSDHGEEFADHGGFWHGTTLYDEQIRVPLLVKLPQGERAGTRLSHWVQSIDIMPTLLTQQGVPMPKGVQGGDLFTGSENVFAEEHHEGNVLQALRRRHDGQAEKLITANPNNPRGLDTQSYYRIDDDPGEQRNLAGQEPTAVARSQAALEAAHRDAKRGAAAKRAVDVEHDAEALERLRALGYVQ